MKIVKLIFLLFIATCLTSCMFYNLKRGFYSYKVPISNPIKENPLKLGGLYLSKQEGGSIFCFYGDGSVLWAGWSSGCCPYNSEEVLLEEIEQSAMNSSKHSQWGHYAIEGDSITIQTFTDHNTEIVKKWIIERKGIMVNDSTFELHSWYSYLHHSSIEHEVETYNFIPRETKPDSSDIWFNNRKWFVEELHESRE